MRAEEDQIRDILLDGVSYTRKIIPFDTVCTDNGNIQFHRCFRGTKLAVYVV